jgi:hypothetical protein
MLLKPEREMEGFYMQMLYLGLGGIAGSFLGLDILPFPPATLAQCVYSIVALAAADLEVTSRGSPVLQVDFLCSQVFMFMLLRGSLFAEGVLFAMFAITSLCVSVKMREVLHLVIREFPD